MSSPSRPLPAAFALAGLVLSVSAGAGSAADLAHPGETHLRDVTQLTFGGENAEAYWSPDGDELVFQSTRPPYECDQIFRMAVPAAGGDGAAAGQAPPEPVLVSTGDGRTTCSYFTDGGERILYSTTRLAAPGCPPRPDHSQGYVWPVYSSYEIVTVPRDGGGEPVRLTDNHAYDAEATLCPVDGSIVFTSTRDGDLDLYRMDPDGSNVRRLTDTPGYDGGAFFSADCSKIVWRASRPHPGQELDDYRNLLAQGLVRPGELELWVADADGGNARQVTYLGAASFAPYFFPSGERIVFSSNYGNDSPREFDLWAVDVQGTRLERITTSPGFDGFPMFSPDGSRLAFSSNRHQGAPGETNVFVARWVEAEPAASDGAAGGSTAGSAAEPGAADRFLADVAWLADDARGGRGLGTPELDRTADWLAGRFSEIGLEPGGDPGADDGERGYLQRFEAPVGVEVGDGTMVAIDGEPLAAGSFRPLGFSAAAGLIGEVVPAGWGITAAEQGIDDYEGLDVGGKIVLVRRFLPAGAFGDDADLQRSYSDLRYKAWNAREHGAAAMLVADLPEPPAEGETVPEEAPLPELAVDARGDAGIPVVALGRAAAEPLLAGGHRAAVAVELVRQSRPASNVVGRIAAGGAPSGGGRLPGAVLLGAHYDHLGMGGSGSLAPDAHEPHNGADDNASGVAALLEAGRLLAARRDTLERDVWLVAFSGEESGLLGSTHLTREPPAGLAIDDLVAMVNLDMVGRLRDDRLSVLGGGSAEEWEGIVTPACDRLGLACELGGDGYGPSDQTPFYAAGVPVLHLFTGTHTDYHKPSDDTATINAAGGARVAELAAELLEEVADREAPPTYRRTAASQASGDSRSSGAWLGTVPDYVGPPGDAPGVLLADVRAGSPAEAAGLRRGDVLVGLGGREIGDIYDFVYALRDAKPGQQAVAVVVRDGHRLELTVTYGKRASPM